MFCRLCCVFLVFFFFKQKTAYEMRISDWSSDVCSSDLRLREPRARYQRPLAAGESFFGSTAIHTAVPDLRVLSVADGPDAEVDAHALGEGFEADAFVPAFFGLHAVQGRCGYPHDRP